MAQLLTHNFYRYKTLLRATMSTKLNFRSIALEIAKYLGIGGLVTTTSILLFWILLDKLHWPLIPVYIGVYIFLAITSYFPNAKYAFKEAYNTSTFVKYCVVYLLGITLGILLIKWVEANFELKDFYLALATIPPRVVFTYSLIKKVVFTKNNKLF